MGHGMSLEQAFGVIVAAAAVILALIGVFLVIFGSRRKKPTVGEQIAAPPVEFRKPDDEGAVDEYDVDFSQAEKKPTCPKCEHELASINLIVTTSEIPDLIYSCPHCHVLLGVSERCTL